MDPQDQSQEYRREYLGQYPMALDSKFRVTIPSEWKAVMDLRNPSTIDNQPLFLYYSGTSIVCYDLAAYTSNKHRLEAKNTFRSSVNLGKVSDASTSKGQARVLIPEVLRELSGMKKKSKVKLVAQNTRDSFLIQHIMDA